MIHANLRQHVLTEVVNRRLRALAVDLTAPVATYYVRKSGNDTTGDGSSATPWLTISKALATVPSGAKVRVGPGTYAESTAGAGYFNVSNVFASYVTVESESGDRDDVTISGASNALFNTLIQNNAAYVRFKNVTFAGWAATTVSACYVANATRIKFTRCRFRIPADATATRFGLRVQPNASGTASYVAMEDCDAVPDGSNSDVRGFWIDATASGSLVNELEVIDCRCELTVGLLAMAYAGNITNFRQRGGRYGGASYGCRVGEDADTATYAITGGLVEGGYFAGSAGHGLILGAGADGVAAERNEVWGGDYGLVIKCACTAKYNVLVGGTAGGVNNSALYVRAANGPVIRFNHLYGCSGTVGVVRVGIGSVNKSQNVTFTDNYVVAVGVKLFNWEGASGDAGGSVSDRNVYELHGAGATFGDVRGANGITTIAGLRAAWAGYGAGANDAGSADAVPERVDVAVSSRLISDKTGFKLAPDGLDSLSVLPPTGPAANFREMVVQLWRRFFKRAVFNRSTRELKTYADDGTTVLTTQTLLEDAASETQGGASA